jgi:hypothetical protein
VTEATTATTVSDGDQVVCAHCAGTKLADSRHVYGWPHNADRAPDGTWLCQDRDACARRVRDFSADADRQRLVATAWQQLLAARLREAGDQVLAIEQRRSIAVHRRDEAIRAAATAGIPQQRIAEYSGAPNDTVSGIIDAGVTG